MILKRLKLDWIDDFIPKASVPGAGSYRLNSENAHPGRLWIPELKWRDDPGFNVQFVEGGKVNPSWPIHEEFNEVEKLLWPPTGNHILSKSAAIRHCEVHAHLMSLSNSDRRVYIRPFVQKLKEMSSQ